jgi:membrane protein DedA with SNARE-associated domain/membrane-associated phospholipid phosphatase
MAAYVQAIVDFISQHPHWAGLLVFLTAATEAIAVIGAFIPGTTILIGVGAVVGLGHLPLWPILIWATLGAIVGDGLSYWIGHRYGHHIGRVWPFSRRPELLVQGEAFFQRHGAKSIVLGRFLPVTRAVVPVVAGTLGMNPWRFYLANIGSAIVWAPLHILPGVVFGGLLAVVGGVSGRLAAVLVCVILLVLAVAWLLRLAVLQIAPLVARLQAAVFKWARGRPGVPARAIAAALDPDNPGARTVLVLGALGVACGIGFLNILVDAAAGDSLVLADAAISNFVQGFRTAWADNVMVAVTMLGDSVVTLPVALAVLLWLLWRRQWRLAGGFAATIFVAEVAVKVVKSTLQLSRPIEIYTGTSAYSFPSGHATMAAVLYGMLALLISTSLSRRGRVIALAAAGGMVGLIAASRIYLGAHWPSDVVAGVSLGFGLAAVFGLVCRPAERRHLQQTGLLPLVLAVLLGVGSWHVWQGFDTSLAAYARRAEITVMTEARWFDDGWRDLAQRRIDLDGEAEESFILQWAGSPEQLRARLEAAGWQPPTGWSLRSAAGFASSAAAASSLPALPLLHDGRTAELTLVSRPAEGAARQILRAWPSDFSVETPDGRLPILLVSIVSERIAPTWGIASLPVVDALPTGRAADSLAGAFPSSGDAADISGARWASPKADLLIATPVVRR